MKDEDKACKDKFIKKEGPVMGTTHYNLSKEDIKKEDPGFGTTDYYPLPDTVYPKHEDIIEELAIIIPILLVGIVIGVLIGAAL